jgi:hypothetical protein
VKLDSGTASIKPTGGMNAAQKSEARKVKLLTVQRESLEKQVQALEEEVMMLVCVELLYSRRSVLTASSGGQGPQDVEEQPFV